jgi:dTDP-4-amino-4,6-dideoxygalactose transaminase
MARQLRWKRNAEPGVSGKPSEANTLIRFMDLSVDAVPRRKYLDAIDSILRTGILVNGPEVEAFEKQVAAYCRTANAIGVGSGTAALYLALRALRIGPGDEVILPALSFVGTANAIAAVGARAIFVDVRTDLLIDSAGIEAAITPKTKALMPVHFTGNVCNMDAITDIARRRSIVIIEDAAPAFGAMYDGKKAGTFGPLGCFSMNPMKVLGGIGEAGVVVTSSGSLASKLRELRYHGIRDKDLCLDVSINGRLDTIQAAILSMRLQRLEQNLSRREVIARLYANRLADIVGVPEVARKVRHAWYHYTILCDRRDDLARALQAKGIETRIYHSRLMPGHPAHAGELDRYPVGRKIVDKILCLPMHGKLDDDHVNRIADVIAEFYGNLT